MKAFFYARRAAGAMAAAVSIICMVPAFAENAGAVWLGSVESTATAPLEDGGEEGYGTEARLVFDSKPEAGIAFRAEGGVRWSYGEDSEKARAFAAGLAQAPAAADLSPGSDLHRTVFLDQAYATATTGPLDLSFGVVPCAWGTGYAYNPTSRTTPPDFPGAGAETAPGSLGATARFALPAGFSAEAYVLAEPRQRSAVPSVGEVSGERFPFGAKLQFRSVLADASVSFFRELAAADGDPLYWTGADVAGFSGPVSWYAEAALRMPEGGTDWDAEAEAVAGFSLTVPGSEATLRVEAIWLGNGADDPADYDAAGFLAGERSLLAKRYFFAMLEKEDPEAGRWKLEGGALVNADDGSTALLAEATLIPVLSFELAVFARVFLSEEDGELGGARSLGGAGFEPYRSAAGIRAKVSF